MPEKPKMQTGEIVEGTLSFGKDMVRWAQRAAKERIQKAQHSSFIAKTQGFLNNVDPSTNGNLRCMIDVSQKSSENGTVTHKTVDIQFYAKAIRLEAGYCDDGSDDIAWLNVTTSTLDEGSHVTEQSVLYLDADVATDAPYAQMGHDISRAARAVG